MEVGFKAQPLKSAEFVDEKTFDAVTRHLPAPAKTFYDTVRLMKQQVAATLRKLQDDIAAEVSNHVFL